MAILTETCRPFDVGDESADVDPDSRLLASVWAMWRELMKNVCCMHMRTLENFRSASDLGVKVQDERIALDDLDSDLQLEP